MKKNQKRILMIAVGLSALYILWLLLKNSKWYASRQNKDVYEEGPENIILPALETGCETSGFSQITSINYDICKSFSNRTQYFS